MERPSVNGNEYFPRNAHTVSKKKWVYFYSMKPMAEPFDTTHPVSAEGGVCVREYIKERALKAGKYIVETNKTVRDIAKEFGISKSTVHKDLTERLPNVNPELSARVEHILHYHKSVRHLRGGEATKQKWKRPV